MNADNVRLGTEKVSHQQQELLQQANRGRGGRMFINAFEQITNDEDILSGEEQLHPDWLEVFDRLAETMPRYAPPRAVESFKEFFAALSKHDAALADLDPESLNTTFLLGAGASKPTPSNIPTVRELLPQLLERARRLDRDDLSRLADFCDERKIDNIEDLLTAAQLATFTSRNPTVLRLVNYLLYRNDPSERDLFAGEPWIGHRSFQQETPSAADLASVAFLQDTLQVLFGLLASTMLPARPNLAHQAIAAYATQHPTESTVITTNYDCCYDLALSEAKQPFSYGIDFVNVTKANAKSDLATLIKLHGSLNWYYCETCQEVQLVELKRMLQQYADDDAPYSVIGICKTCGGQRRGLLVPPYAMKFDVAPPLTPLLPRARHCFEESDLIVVLGFSFADADVYISRMISKSMHMKESQKLVIADPSGDVVARMRRKFRASIPNFDGSRIIKLQGDCAETIPSLLRGEFRREKKVKAKQGGKAEEGS